MYDVSRARLTCCTPTRHRVRHVTTIRHNGLFRLRWRLKKSPRGHTMEVRPPPLQRRARAQHATRARRPASARKHASPDPAPCTARPQHRTQHDPALHNTHYATKHNNTQHTACCTQSRVSHQPPHSRQTPGTDAACAKSHACVGALRLQHPGSTSNIARWPFKGPQHMLHPLTRPPPVIGDQQARPAPPPERATRPGTRQSAHTPREDGAASPSPKEAASARGRGCESHVHSHSVLRTV